MSPKKSARIGALARANSSASTTFCIDAQALAAVLGGPGGADPAALVQLLRPLLVEPLRLVGTHLEALVEPALGQVLLQPGADLLAELLGVGRIGQVHLPILTRGSSSVPATRDGSEPIETAGLTMPIRRP